MSDATGHTPLDRAIARLAVSQYGVISLPQLVQLGISASAVRARVGAGKLHGIHRGVYAVGHRVLSREGRWMAAVLACGEGAVLSHRSAAELLNVARTRRTLIDVTSRTRAGRRRDGIRVHSGATLNPRDVAAVDRIPCTSVPRTLLDLAEVVDRHALQRAVERAELLRLFDLGAVHELLRRSAGRRGALPLTAAIADHRPTMTRSEMEDLFLAICDEIGAPRPLVNVWLGDIEVDFMWPELEVIVEVDGFETHGTRTAFAGDRRRDRRLRRTGWRVERFTWWELRDEPEAVAADLREILSAAASAR